MASGTRVRFSSLIYQNISFWFNVDCSLLHLKYECKLINFCLICGVYLIVFLFIMFVYLLSMVIQFEWTTLNPGAIPPRCRSLERKPFELLWPSKASSQQSHMILNPSLTKEDCAHIVRWPVPPRRCSRTQRSCQVWCKPRANQNWLNTGTSILHMKIQSLYKRFVILISLRDITISPCTTSVSVDICSCFKCEPFNFDFNFN